MSKVNAHGASSDRSPVRRAGIQGAVALGILGTVGLAVAALHAGGDESAAAVAAPTPVLTLPLKEQPGHYEALRFAGRLEPARETQLGFERGGLLAEVLAAEGERVAAGQIVARFDTALLANERARLEAARDRQAAAVELARLTFARQEALTDRVTSDQRKDEARLAVAAAEAALTETEAAIAGIGIEIAKSELRAPYAGTVAARLSDEGAVLAPGEPVLVLLEADRPRARIGLTAEVAASLVRGDTYTLRDQDSASQPARLAAVRPDLDGRTRTITALFELDGPVDVPLGTIVRFEAETWIPGPGFWIPISALVEAPNGLWTVLTVGSDASLGSEAVTVAALRDGEAFVQGSLRDGDRIVPDGTHRVRPGQDVRIAQAE